MDIDISKPSVQRANKTHTNMVNQTTILGRSGVVIGLNKSIAHKKKAHKLVPRLLDKSKCITKGTGYQQKINKRKASVRGAMISNAVARSQGSNNLSAKHINETKYLKTVQGMAMTKSQKKKMLRKLNRRQEQEDESSSMEEDLPVLKI